MSIEWTTRQLSSAGIRRLVDRPLNPKPRGHFRPGSAAEAVMVILDGSPGRCFFRRQLIVMTGRTRKAVDWALLYLVATRRVETVPEAERARAAGECPALPEPYTRQWINAPFTERLLFTEDQMRQYAAAASAEARALADSEGTRAVKCLRRARKAEAKLAEENGDDQAWDRNAERITREALGDDVTRPINPHATSIDDL